MAEMESSTASVMTEVNAAAGRDEPGECVANTRNPGARVYGSGYKRISQLWTSMLIEEDKLKSRNPQPTNLEVADNTIKIPPAMLDQGLHEVQVEAEGLEGQVHWNLCQKNPGHSSFIPSTEFIQSDLPVPHRDPDIFKYIQLWSNMVGKVTVSQISNGRPQGYAFYNYRGTALPIAGTGKVAEVTKEENIPCPCVECQSSGQPKQEWMAVWVMTAKHIIYDDSEAACSVMEFFFDVPDNTQAVRKLTGVRVVDSNESGDWCKFECATHDFALGLELQEIDRQVLLLGQTINDKNLARNFPALAVICSHPHGCAKCITVGEWKERKVVKNLLENHEWTEYYYTTATCPGCSGAPVWILGPERSQYSYNYYSHVHSEGVKNGLNKSGAGDIEKKWDA